MGKNYIIIVENITYGIEANDTQVFNANSIKHRKKNVLN